MFHRRQHPADVHDVHPADRHHWFASRGGSAHPQGVPRAHFWNRHPQQQQQRHPADWNGDYVDSYNGVRGYAPVGPHSEFRHGDRGRWEHVQYADNQHPTGRMSHREKNMYATPFGTPGFAAENLLADNPWTHDTLGYDYYDYYADQAVRGPFGVAPGSVVPPSQRPFLGGGSARDTRRMEGAPRRGMMYKMFHRGAPAQQHGGNYPARYDDGYSAPRGGYGTGNTNARGLNKGYMPPGAQYAHTNMPYVSEGFHEEHEDILPEGGWERYETDVTQTTHQDVVYGGRGLNAAKSTYGRTRNPAMVDQLPMNIPSASTTTTTITSTDGNVVPIGSDFERKAETVVSAENPTTGLPMNTASLAKNAK